MNQSVKLPLTITLSTALLLGACGVLPNTKAVEPLSAVCDGKPMPNTAALNPKDGVYPTVAIHRTNSGDTRVRNGFLPAKWGSNKLETTQLVYCIKDLPNALLERCPYRISGPSITVERYRNRAELMLLEAKTGKVFSTGQIEADAEQCPSTVSARENRTEPEVRKYEAIGEINTKIETWFSEQSSKLGANPGSPTAPSALGVGVGQPADPKKQYKVGDAIRIQAESVDLVIALDSIREHKGIPKVSEPAANEKWLVVKVSNRNQSKDAFYASYLSYTLKDSQGKVYESDARVTSKDDLKELPSTIAPGATVTGDLGFVVPANAKGLVLVFDIRNEGGCKDPKIAKAFYCHVVKIALE